MVRLRSIGVLSCATILAVVQGAIGILVGLLFLFFGMIGGILGSAMHAGHNGMGMVGVVVVAIFMPVVYAIFGFIAGAIAAFVYNLAADAFGGIELQFESRSAPATAAPAGSGA